MRSSLLRRIRNQTQKHQTAVQGTSGIQTDCRILAYLRWYHILQVASWCLESFCHCIYKYIQPNSENRIVFKYCTTELVQKNLMSHWVLAQSWGRIVSQEHGKELQLSYK